MSARKPNAKTATPATRKPGEPKAKPTQPKPQPSNCGCGCGSPTVTAKATFLAGHDARHAGNLGRALAATTLGPEREALTKQANALTPALKAKVLKVAETANRKADAKEARKVAAAAAKRAYDEAMAKVS